MALWRLLVYVPERVERKDAPFSVWFRVQEPRIQAVCFATVTTLMGVSDWEDPDLREFKVLSGRDEGLGEIRFGDREARGQEANQTPSQVSGHLASRQQRIHFAKWIRERVDGPQAQQMLTAKRISCGGNMAKGGVKSMSLSSELWSKFAESREFREEYMAALAKRAFSMQVRAIRKSQKLSQEELAAAAQIDQGVISRAENPNYGNLTFDTAIRVSAGFDLAFIPQIVSYSEFLKWAKSITEGREEPKTFEQEQTAQSASDEQLNAAQEMALVDTPRAPDFPVRKT